MMQTSPATHETMELLELLTFKTVCLTKSKTMQVLATDPVLKGIMQADVQKSIPAIEDLQKLLAKVNVQ
jgi:similar to spore coat protein